MSRSLKLFCDSFGFPSFHKPPIMLEDLLCTCQLLTKWGYSVSLSTVNFNNLLEGPHCFYHIINDDSIFLCHSISSTDPRPYYSPVMKCNGVVIGPHYTRSGNIRHFLITMSPAGDSQWETKHTSFLMQAIIQITFQLETSSPISVFHLEIALLVLGLGFVSSVLCFKIHINSLRDGANMR